MRAFSNIFSLLSGGMETIYGSPVLNGGGGILLPDETLQVAGSIPKVWKV